ncbi:hypothetical protein H17ap60334_08800 [Thermosipho africanus H17ap60334]|nr:hypothetical protein H17ap60334_08800 [Thermosipho africanus H17ap60334]
MPIWLKREAGENPARPRHCNRGRNPQYATGKYSWEGVESRMIRKPGDLPLFQNVSQSRGKIEKNFLFNTLEVR